METKQITIYDFDELSDEVQEDVLSKFREQNDYHFLEENLNEELSELLKENEIKETGETKLRYGLSYSQGDGLSFVGDFEYKGFNFNIDLNSWGNHYQHSKTTNINLIDDDDSDSDDITEEIKEIREREFKEVYFDICDKLEKNGYAQIEHADSDDTIKETIKINEYKFRASGEIEW